MCMRMQVCWKGGVSLEVLWIFRPDPALPRAEAANAPIPAGPQHDVCAARPHAPDLKKKKKPNKQKTDRPSYITHLSTFLTAAAKMKAFLDKIPGIKKLTAN